MPLVLQFHGYPGASRSFAEQASFAGMGMALIASATRYLNIGGIVRYVGVQGAAMVLGIFWRGTTRQGAVAGMLGGLAITVYYMLSHVLAMQALPRWLLADGLWWGIQPISAGVFGVPAGLVLAALVSWITRPAPHRPPVRLEM